MTALSIAIAATVFACTLWRIADYAACKRRLELGAFPLVWIMGSIPFVFIASMLLTTTAAALVACALEGVLICAVTDVRTGAIFDPVTLTIALVALLLASLSGQIVGALSGALVTGGALFSLHASTRGRGLGLGDVKLAGVLGLSLGLPTSALALGAAFVIGGTYGAWLLAGGRARGSDSMRFGPFIAAGAAIAIVLQISGTFA